MITDNTQELDEILFDLYQYRSSRPHSINQKQVLEKRQAILDWHNKQIEKSMAKFSLKKVLNMTLKPPIRQSSLRLLTSQRRTK